MNAEEKQYLREKVVAWEQAIQASNIPNVTYTCPHCDAQYIAACPEQPGEIYDSLVRCLECEGVFQRTVAADGRVTCRYPKQEKKS